MTSHYSIPAWLNKVSFPAGTCIGREVGSSTGGHLFVIQGALMHGAGLHDVPVRYRGTHIHKYIYNKVCKNEHVWLQLLWWLAGSSPGAALVDPSWLDCA
jgi:hypothetical protein